MKTITIDNLNIDLHDGNIGVAVSGGADSALLLYILMKNITAPISIVSCGNGLTNNQEPVNALKITNEVMKLTGKKNIYFTTQKTFPKCKNKRCLPFDFYINIYDMDILIEYNGIQHYKSINHFGGDTSFEQRQINDNIKLNYTIDNEIPFIIIPYNISNKEDIYKYLNLEIDKYFKQ